MGEVTDVSREMNVYLVPAGATRHELYCEAPADEPVPDSTRRSLWGRMAESFRSAVREGEQEQAGTADQPAAKRGRFRRAIARRIAAVVAEQRLLWRLRHETAVRLMHPDDLTGERALEMTLAELGADLAKHRNWCVIDGLLTAITGPALFFVPGPNVVGFYFLFRTIGHYFAYRGAHRGVKLVRWTPCASAPLTDLRRALDLSVDERARRVDDIAHQLGLERLSVFVARVSERAAASAS
jgi:hypothetical protein